jgi:hypothetical protein
MLPERDLDSPVSTFYPEATVALFDYGLCAIVVEDHCYQLRLWVPSHGWRPTSYWPEDAVKKLKQLPDDPDFALDFSNRPSGTLE